MPVTPVVKKSLRLWVTPVSENEPSELILQREKKLQAIVDLGFEAYPRKYDVTRTIPQVVSENAALSAEELAGQKVSVRVAGRVMTIRPHGKAGRTLQVEDSGCKSMCAWMRLANAISSSTSSSIWEI